MAEQKQLRSAFSLFKPSTEAVRQNVFVYLLLFVIPTLLISYESGTSTEVQLNNIFQVTLIAGGILTLLAYPPLIYTYLHASDGETVSLSKAFSVGYKKFWTLLGLAILVGLVIMVGFLFFIIPGFIFLRRYMLSPFYVMDRNMGISEAMKTSATESKQFSGAVYGLIGVTLLIGIVSVFGLPGMIASTIMSVLYATAPAIRYHEIKRSL